MKTAQKLRGWSLSLLFVLIGIGASLYLTVQHFSVLKFGFTGRTLCNISPYLNCDMVLLSRFSEIGTIPTAGLGLLFYLYMLGALIYVRMEPDRAAKTLTLPYLLILFSCGLSLFLAYVSVYQIEALCIFCITLYVVSFFLLFSIRKVMGMSFGEWLKNFKNVSWLKSFGYLFIVFVAGGIIFHTSHKHFAKDIPQKQLEAYLEAFSKLPAKKIDTEGRPFWGNPEGKVEVVEFSDFECPYCKRAAFTLKPMLADYRDQVKFVFMNYPLDSSCNPAMQRALHKKACSAAFAAYCAGEQGKFWEYHDKAFDRQPKFQPASLQNMAKKLKLDLGKFNECLQSEETKQAISSDVQQAVLLGIRGTPAVFVNGRPFMAWQSKKAWKQLIERISQGTPASPLSPSPTN